VDLERRAAHVLLWFRGALERGQPPLDDAGAADDASDERGGTHRGILVLSGEREEEGERVQGRHFSGPRARTVEKP
jgi:hypothetical protein